MSRLRSLNDPEQLPALDPAFVIRRPGDGLGEDRIPISWLIGIRSGSRTVSEQRLKTFQRSRLASQLIRQHTARQLLRPQPSCDADVCHSDALKEMWGHDGRRGVVRHLGVACRIGNTARNASMGFQMAELKHQGADPTARCSWVERKPSFDFMKPASAGHASRNPCSSTAPSVNTLTEGALTLQRRGGCSAGRRNDQLADRGSLQRAGLHGEGPRQGRLVPHRAIRMDCVHRWNLR